MHFNGEVAAILVIDANGDRFVLTAKHAVDA
jgi:hypothetical protein